MICLLWKLLSLLEFNLFWLHSCIWVGVLIPQLFFDFDFFAMCKQNTCAWPLLTGIHVHAKCDWMKPILYQVLLGISFVIVMHTTLEMFSGKHLNINNLQIVAYSKKK